MSSRIEQIIEEIEEYIDLSLIHIFYESGLHCYQNEHPFHK